MRLTIASGKGGTGKTLVSTNLSCVLEQRGVSVTYVDADVEAPNGDLFLSPADLMIEEVTVPTPALRAERCHGHAKCQEICAFNAILAAKGNIVVFDELCHSCGACRLACPDNALVERPRLIGEIRRGVAAGIRFLGGRLNIGEARAVPLIAALLDRLDPRGREEGVIIVDAPPGVACSAVEAVKGADMVLLVTEPTPFGCHDLALAVEMCRAVEVTPAAVINRCDLGDREIYHLLERLSVPILAEIPFERTIASAYAGSRLAYDQSETLRRALEAVADTLLQRWDGMR